MVEIQVNPKEPSQVVKIDKGLNSELAQQLADFLRQNQDMFTWTRPDMVGIHPEIMCHQLNIDPQAKPVRQKRRVLDANRYKALQDEVDRLLKIGFIRESYYPDWLANLMLVLKPNGKWRISIDFTNLNKACPKDSFPLPRIDQLVDATTRHELLGFMDACLGYNHIPTYESNEEHTSFITDCGLYCYNAMPFGLKNVRATYQRLVNMMFKNLIGKTMEVYWTTC